MSLNAVQRRAISATFSDDFSRTGLSYDAVARDLEFSECRLRATLRMSFQADGSDGWLLRDYLHQAAIDKTGSAAVQTILTDESRGRAQMWFTLRPAPRHAFNAPAGR